MKVVVVDSDITGDHRVLRSIWDGIGGAVVLNISDPYSFTERITAGIKCGYLFLKLIDNPAKTYRLLKKRLGGRVDRHLTSGLLACLRLIFVAICASKRIRKQCSSSNETISLYAHDLYCGYAAALAKGSSHVELVYDAHELEIHRNRKAGWLRILIEYGLEQTVLNRSTELKVVNAEILSVMREWYQLPTVAHIAYNDFYTHHAVTLSASTTTITNPCIVYVGKGVNGRQLEYIDTTVAADLFEIHLFLLGSLLPAHIKGHGWQSGPLEYEPSLVSLAASRRCLMWCCLENRCLSYQLATPNKFFQALAVGIPLIVSEGSYLSKIVREHDIGMVFCGDNLLEIRSQAQSDAFERWVANIVILRERLRSNEVII